MAKNSSMPVVKPEEVGLSSDRLARIKPAMQKFIDQQWLPNAVMLIARDGKIAYYEAIGRQDCAKGTPCSKDTLFCLYSNTKAVTGLATMILYEDGKLKLDDPVSRYIPAFKNLSVIAPPNQVPTDGRGMPVMFATIPAKREITIRDCLRNTTGLATPERAPYWFATQFKDILPETGWDLQNDLNTPPPEGYRHRVEMHARLPLTFHPGTDFVYHVGYPVVGAVIEAITGKTLEDFYRERIFQPLDMQDTSFYLDRKNVKRFTCCYLPVMHQNRWQMKLIDQAENSVIKGKGKYCGAGGDMGGLISTAGDYARFGQMLLNGGELDGVRIISRKSVEIMTSSHTKKLNIPMLGEGFGFGMGVGMYTGGSHNPILRSPGTFGWGGAAGTMFFADPKEKLLAICFTQMFAANMIPENNYQEEFERLVYQALI